ncbi:centromere protein C isoform X2 [Dromaius novaehollandiae]|uniref:centromere protein C isoform X2 n=1 Tax=Dromaius novaehollandiae TaxID=8790 RepID=UPI00311EE08E
MWWRARKETALAGARLLPTNGAGRRGRCRWPARARAAGKPSENHFKKDYRARFCHGGGKQIDVQPGQNILKIIQDCFKSYGSDVTINSPSTTHCSTPVVTNKKETSIQREKPNAGLTNSVKSSCNSADSLAASPLKPVISKGWSLESHLKPATHDYISDANKIDSPVSKGESSNKIVTADISDLVRSPGKTNNLLKDIEALCRSPANCSVFEDDHQAVGSPILVKEAISSPVHILHFNEQNTPVAVKSHVEAENLGGPQAGKNEQLVLVQGTDHIAISSVQKKKSSFSSAFLAAVTTGTLGKRYSASISPPSPPLVKDQDLEIENECEFLIDESDGVSFNSWFSIPQKNKKSKKDGSTTPVLKSQSSERQQTESKKGKNRKVQVEALDKQQMHDLDARVQADFRSASELAIVSPDREGNVLKSQRQSSTHMEKTKKEALKQDSPKQRKGTSWKPEDEELLLSLSGLDTKASDAERCKKRVMLSEDSSMPSAGDQQEQTLWPKKNLKSSNYVQSTLRTSQHLVHKKQNVKQKLSKDTVSKKLSESARKKMKAFGKKSSNRKPLLPTVESSGSEPGEEGLERESVKLREVFLSPLHLKLQTSKIQNLANSEKRKNVLHSLESLGDTNNKTPVKAKELLQNLTDTVQNCEERSSAKSPRTIPEEIHHKAHKSVCSNSEDVKPQNTTDSESSSLQDKVEKKPKPSDVKIKSNKRKRNMQHGSQDSSAAEKTMNHRSGPLLEHGVKFTSKRKSFACKQDNSSSDNSEDLNCQINDLLSNKIARHKIVMPSNTPNVRRTKRIRLRPLEYWRGERVNYTMRPSGLVISGIVCPETEPRRKIKRKKRGHKQKGGDEIAANLDQTLADTSKPTVVLDPIANKEVLLECINTGNRHSCFFKDESVEIYKNLNTSDFATGKLVLKPFKEKGHQFVHMDTIAFHVIQGKIVLTLHKTSYYLTTGDFFYVPAGNGYNIRNILNEKSILLFTQLKRDRPKAGEEILETSSP